MLNRFREGGVVQFLMGGVVVLIIAAFTLDVRQGSSGFDTECVVRVSEECVPPRDFNAAFRLSVNPELTNKELKRLGVREMIVDGLVERQLLVAEARELGIAISDDELDRELALGRFHYSMPAVRDGQIPMLTYARVTDPKTERFNYKIYERSVRNYARMSTKDFKANQRVEMTAARMRELVKAGVRVSEAEAFAHFQHTRSKATVRVAQVNANWFARYATRVTDEAVAAYAAEHASEVDSAFEGQKDRFTEGCAYVREIFFAHPPAADASDESKTKERAETVARQARARGADFGRLARQHSGAESASVGGYRGCLDESRGGEEKELAKAVEGLEPGSLSELVALPRGLYLLRLEGRLASGDELETTGKTSVARNLLATQQGSDAARAFALRVREAVAGGQAMQTAVTELSRIVLEESGVDEGLRAAALESPARPQVEVSSSFTRTSVVNPIPNALDETAARQVAFTLDKVGAVYPEPIDTRDGFAVLQVKELEPATREAFEKEKSEFIQDFKRQAQIDALIAHVDRLREGAEKGIEINPRFLESEKASDDS